MSVRSICILASSLLLSTPAVSASYLFSYDYGDGNVITGSFEGTANGDLVTIDSDVLMSFNGIAFTGPLSARGNIAVAGDGTQCGSEVCFPVTEAGIMSADPAKNDFLIANYGANGSWFGTNYFYIFPWANSPLGLGLQANFNGLLYDSYNGLYKPDNWALTAANAPVPEPEIWALMIGGLGLVGAAMRRRAATAVRFA